MGHLLYIYKHILNTCYIDYIYYVLCIDLHIPSFILHIHLIFHTIFHYKCFHRCVILIINIGVYYYYIIFNIYYIM